MKILVVDDDQFILELVNTILDKENHEISNASCYDEAISFLENQNFDLVITDIIMPPGNDGTKLISYIKAKNPNMPVIAMTAGLENAVDDYVNWANLFADESIGKPFKSKELVGCINEVTRL